jgi:hypothetical protein
VQLAGRRDGARSQPVSVTCVSDLGQAVLSILMSSQAIAGCGVFDDFHRAVHARTRPSRRGSVLNSIRLAMVNHSIEDPQAGVASQSKTAASGLIPMLAATPQAVSRFKIARGRTTRVDINTTDIPCGDVRMLQCTVGRALGGSRRQRITGRHQRTLGGARFTVHCFPTGHVGIFSFDT